MCDLFGISRQAHFQQRQREAQRQVEEEWVLELVRQVRRRHPQMGGRKLLDKLQPQLRTAGLGIGRDRFFALLSSQGLLVPRKRGFRRTTRAGFWRAPNRLRGLTVTGPNQVWVCDITYLELQGGGFVYLFLLMDLFARYIVGWHVSRSLAAEGALRSLEMALAQLPVNLSGLIHHSDHGVQYSSHAYLDTLLAHSILPSMGAVGNCYDNIFAERLIGTLKQEYGLGSSFVNVHQVLQTLEEAVGLYNTDRPHYSLNLAVPSQVYYGHILDVPLLAFPADA